MIYLPPQLITVILKCGIPAILHRCEQLHSVAYGECFSNNNTVTMNIINAEQCIYAPIHYTMLQTKKDTETSHKIQRAPQESITELLSGHCASV